jgi:hypothetical protein
MALSENMDLKKLLVKFEETQIAQNRLQAEQHRLQAEQLQLLRELAEKAQSNGSQKLETSRGEIPSTTPLKAPLDPGHVSIQKDYSDDEGHTDLVSHQGSTSDTQSTGGKVQNDGPLHSISDTGRDGPGDPEADGSSLTPGDEADQRVRQAMEDNRFLDNEKLLSLRDDFLASIALWYDHYLMATELKDCPFTAGNTVNARSQDLERAWKFKDVEGDEKWQRFVRDTWPEIEDMSGHMKCANAMLDDNLCVGEFTHDRNGGLFHLEPLDRLPTAEASPKNMEAWTADDKLRNWNGKYVLMPRPVPVLNQS